jgi:hypothetical protein
VIVARVSIPLTLVVIGFGAWVIGMFAPSIWAIDRIAHGWLALWNGKPLPASTCAALAFHLAPRVNAKSSERARCACTALAQEATPACATCTQAHAGGADGPSHRWHTPCVEGFKRETNPAATHCQVEGRRDPCHPRPLDPRIAR